MSRFNHVRNTQVGSYQLQVRIRHSGHRTQITNKLAGEVGKARNLLDITLAQLNNGKLGTRCKRFLHRYFLTPEAGPSTADLERIKSILLLTSNGLNSDMTIKVGLNAGSGDDDVHGEVNQFRGGARKSYHTSGVVDLDDGLTYTTKAIKMDQDTLLNGGRLAVVTLVHEATHKYAGTNDYCYFDDDSYTPDGVFNDKTQALKNADSYAWFTYKMGKTYQT